MQRAPVDEYSREVSIASIRFAPDNKIHVNKTNGRFTRRPAGQAQAKSKAKEALRLSENTYIIASHSSDALIQSHFSVAASLKKAFWVNVPS